MNMVALNNRLASKVPHWHELEMLSKEDKIDIIALLSMSIANAEDTEETGIIWAKALAVSKKKHIFAANS